MINNGWLRIGSLKSIITINYVLFEKHLPTGPYICPIIPFGRATD